MPFGLWRGGVQDSGAADRAAPIHPVRGVGGKRQDLTPALDPALWECSHPAVPGAPTVRARAPFLQPHRIDKTDGIPADIAVSTLIALTLPRSSIGSAA